MWERKGGGSEREREEGGEKRKRSGGGGNGEGVAQRADDVVVTHPKTLQLSLSSQQRAGLERKQKWRGGGGCKSKGTVGRAQPYSVACARFFPPGFA